MSRNDAALYSGINASQAVTHPVREKAKEVKAENQAKLTPELEILLEFIRDEKQSVKEKIVKLATDIDTKEADIKCELRAFQKDLAFIDGFSTRLVNTMRRSK